MQRYVLKLIQELYVAIYISCISNCIYITLITCIIIIDCYAQIHCVYMIDNIFILYMNWYLKLNGLNRPLANSYCLGVITELELAISRWAVNRTLLQDFFCRRFKPCDVTIINYETSTKRNLAISASQLLNEIYKRSTIYWKQTNSIVIYNFVEITVLFCTYGLQLWRGINYTPHIQYSDISCNKKTICYSSVLLYEFKFKTYYGAWKLRLQHREE